MDLCLCRFIYGSNKHRSSFDFPLFSKSSNLITSDTFFGGKVPIFRGEIQISRTAIVNSVLIKEDPIKSALVRSASVRLVLSIFAFVR
jgi:hypothetical protein